MERKRSLIVAGAVSGTLLAASTAYALTGGLLDRPAPDGAGTLAPVTATFEGGAPTTGPPQVGRAGLSPGTASVGGDHDEGSVGRDGRRLDTGSTVHEYEGADDDD